MKKYLGIIMILLSCLITVYLWVGAKTDTKIIVTNPLTSASQIMALIGLILMSYSLLLSTRNRLIESIFGGLDNVYFIHRIIGSFSFLLVLNHPILLAVKALPQVKIASMYIIPGRDLSYNFGIAALLIMMFSFIFIVFVKLPYHLWKYSHKFLALSFLLVGVHGLLIQSDISTSLILRYWMLFFISIGVAAGFYIIFLYKSLGPRYTYEVEKIERKLDILNIYLKPILKTIFFRPGQFVYLSFFNKHIGNESHPFSISSAPNEETLRISAKILGDHTLKFPELEVKDKVFVYGPYGNFGKVYNTKEKKNYIWVAGGIGVTPFLSMLRSEYYNPTENKTTFFYCYKNKDEGVFCDEINAYGQKTKNVKCVFWCSQELRRLTIDKIIDVVGNLNDCNIMLCGPPVMMESLKKQSLDLGIEEKKIYYENFSLI